MSALGQVYCHLVEQWTRRLGREPGSIVFFFCHRRGRSFEKFAEFGGLQDAHDLLLEHLGLGEEPPPILLVGLHELEFVKKECEKHRPGASRILDWEAAKYIQYVATLDELQHAARQVIADRDEALPILYDPHGLLALSESIRHSLKNVRHALGDFYEAVGETDALSPAYLKPRPPWTDDQMEDMKRLRNHAAATGMPAGVSDRLERVLAAIVRFEQAWIELEVVKAMLRDEEHARVVGFARSQAVAPIVASVMQAVEDAMLALQELDVAIHARGAKDV